jgi:acetyl-CoA acetyltransferase
VDPSILGATFGTPETRFTAIGWGGGGGSVAAAFLFAAMAVATGQANFVAVTRGVVMGGGNAGTGPGSGWRTRRYGTGLPGTPEHARFPLLTSPVQMFGLTARRHMHAYGTTTDHFGEVTINARRNAANNPDARFRTPITMDDHHNSRMIADPLRLLDCCMESDSGSCVIVTSAERAKDLRHPPVYIRGCAVGAPYRWGLGNMGGNNMSAEDFASAGQRTVAGNVYRHAGVGPDDIDVALIYDHFTSAVLMGLEDFGFVPKGESGPFVADGNIGLRGRIPVNTHGGNLAEVYNHGMSHVCEAMRQMRGTAPNQITGADVALVVGGSAPTPTSAMIVRR